MEPINLLRYLITRSQERQIMSSYLEKDVNQVRNKPKFLLPAGGKVFDIHADLKELPDDIKLPYNEFSIEYPSLMHRDNLDQLVGGQQKIPLKYEGVEQIPYNSLVLVKQLEREFEVRVVILISGDGNGSNEIWQRPSFTARVENRVNRNPKDKDLGLEITMDDKAPEFVKSEAYETYTKFPDVFNSIFKYVYLEPIFAVLELVVALQCKNVTHHATEPRKLNKGAKKRGALPFDSYRVLTVITNGKAEKIITNNQTGGDRHSPREHMRRGHIRTCASGIKTWVQPTVVNAGIGSVLNKDYRIK